jgi:DNA-binding NarL/FixJ family response regulator
MISLSANYHAKLIDLAYSAGASRVYDKARVTPEELVAAFRELLNIKPTPQPSP